MGESARFGKDDGSPVPRYIEGSGYFDEQRDSFAYEIEGANYFDFERDCLIGAESLVWS